MHMEATLMFFSESSDGDWHRTIPFLNTLGERKEIQQIYGRIQFEKYGIQIKFML